MKLAFAVANAVLKLQIHELSLSVVCLSTKFQILPTFMKSFEKMCNPALKMDMRCLCTLY